MTLVLISCHFAVDSSNSVSFFLASVHQAFKSEKKNDYLVYKKVTFILRGAI